MEINVSNKSLSDFRITPRDLKLWFNYFQYALKIKIYFVFILIFVMMTNFFRMFHNFFVFVLSDTVFVPSALGLKRYSRRFGLIL